MSTNFETWAKRLREMATDIEEDGTVSLEEVRVVREVADWFDEQSKGEPLRLLPDIEEDLGETK